jgi:multicomponent Na+:H+ antiporter subunit G
MVSPVDLLSWLLLLAGGMFCVIGAIGLLRMPDFYTRMHAASVIETLGAGLLFIAVLIFFTSPAATHALARAARLRGLTPIASDQDAPPSNR